jgi:hypothetical protein
MSTPVREITMPADMVSLAGLDPVDYSEAFTFATDAVRRPEEWARLILEGAPLAQRIQMRGIWTALGIRLAMPGTRGQVLGWRIGHNDPAAVVLGVRAGIGLTARIVVHAEPGRVTHAMVVRYDRAIARRVWARLAPKHRAFLGGLLLRASQPASGTTS